MYKKKSACGTGIPRDRSDDSDNDKCHMPYMGGGGRELWAGSAAARALFNHEARTGRLQADTHRTGPSSTGRTELWFRRQCASMTWTMVDQTHDDPEQPEETNIM